MKKVVLCLFVFLLSCTSCNTGQNHDSDHDSDRDSQDLPDLHDEDKDSAEDKDSSEDKDTQPDEDSDRDTVVKSDYDYPEGNDNDPDCPNLKMAGFPNYDDKGKITFCRKCDLPAPANDPQCVRNLWEMNNRLIMERFPEYYCYPLPCDVTEKAIKNDSTILGKCDFDAESKIYHGSTAIFKQGDIWEGKVGMYASAGKNIDGKYIVIGSLLYEISTGKYTMVAWADSKQAYKYDRFVFLAGNTYDYQSYILSALKVENGWKYEVAYTNEQKKVEFLYPPAVGKNYVLINVTRSDTTSAPREILYASVKDWKWTKLGEGTIIYPQINEDIAFFGFNKSVWACDLTKLPADIETGCKRINRENEIASAPFPKKGNSSLVAYIGGDGLYKFTIADISKNPVEYKDLNIQPQSPDLISYTSGQWDGDIIAFSELYQFSEVDVDYRMCYYSISKNKKVCFPNPSPSGNPMGYIYAGVEGKYITYQPTGAVILKDMECYCKEYPDQCLYDEYMPDETGDDDSIPDSDVPVYIY